MATNGSFDFNLAIIGNTTNNSIGVVESVTEEISNQGELIGLGIALAIALTLIFGAIFVAIDFIPRLLGKLRGMKT